MDAPAAGQLAVQEHVGAQGRSFVNEELRGPVRIRRQLGTARVRVHRHGQIAEAEDAESGPADAVAGRRAIRRSNGGEKRRQRPGCDKRSHVRSDRSFLQAAGGENFPPACEVPVLDPGLRIHAHIANRDNDVIGH